MEKYCVYVKTDGDAIIAVNSDVFQSDLEGWVKIDEGDGVRYLHAQGNYFPKPIRTELGAYRYRLVDGVAQELSDAEVAEQEAAILAALAPSHTTEERITELEEALALLLSGVTE